VTLWHKVVATLIVALAGVAAGCSDSGNESSSTTTTSESNKVVLVTHDSFAIPRQVKAAFEKESGLRLTILQGGDAGEMVNRALLTKGNPQGDVLFGIDNNLLSRALDEGLFEPYVAGFLEFVDAPYLIDPTHAVTPIDHGDVCLNVDRTWFASHGVAPPQTLADLTQPPYKDLLVVENPATSTPGLAFMLATIAKFGEDGWQDYWRRLRTNGVLAVDGWEEAYTTQFSGAGGSKGKRPIVVSYATSPAAEVIYAKTPPKTSPTAVVADSCFRQIELAGVLDGARNPKGARAFIDFMLSKRFQASMPESMFVLPVRDGTPLAEAFEKYAVSPPSPLELPAEEIGDNRDRWIDEWTQVVLR
jgi:thiamine transport system substrate-binding protein